MDLHLFAKHEGKAVEGQEFQILGVGGTRKGVYSTRGDTQKTFDLNQYTVKKGVKGWGGLKGNIEALEQEGKNREKNEQGEIPAMVQHQRAQDGPKFGTWNGVWLACMQNILGVIMYLRIGWVVGQAGIGLGLVIVILSNVVTIITALSMSAICTNGKVRGGGAYYLISRTLGPFVGAPIGALFSLGQSVSVALYVIGFCETLVDQISDKFSPTGSNLNDVRVYGIVVVFLLLVMAWIGTGWVMNSLQWLLVYMFFSIILVIIGTFSHTNEDEGFVGWKNTVISENAGPEYRDGMDFFGVFAVFFPAVTGIMAGANMSGDLENPSKNIPTGTLFAIFHSTVVYITLIIFIGATVERGPEGADYGLYENFLIYLVVAVPYIGAPVVLIAIFASTFSSGLISLVGAPRILQALAEDELIPFLSPFAVMRESDNSPTRGYLLTYLIGTAAVCVGSLNAVAPLISMFYMITYGMINFSCFVLAISKSPSWRPKFRFYNKFVALAGALICIAIMFATDWIIAIAAFGVAIGLYLYVSYLDPNVHWGTASQALKIYNLEKQLMRMKNQRFHVKTFKPHILVMSGEPQDRLHLCRLAASLRKGYGITIYGNVLVGDFNTAYKAFLHKGYQKGYYEDSTLTDFKVQGFTNNVIARSVLEGYKSMLCNSGLGFLRPNIVLFGFKEGWESAVGNKRFQRARSRSTNRWSRRGSAEIKREPSREASEDAKREKPRNWMQKMSKDVGDIQRGIDLETEISTEEYVEMIKSSFRLRMGVMIGRNLRKIPWSRSADKQHEGDMGPIDVWWLVDDGGLTCLVPHLLSLHRWWRRRCLKSQGNCKVRLRLVVPEGQKEAQATVVNMLELFRIPWENDVKAVHLGETTGDVLENYKTYSDFKAVFKESKEKSEHWMKVSREIQKESKDASLVFITLPMPLEGIEPVVYMAWLEELSKDRPTVLIRGNGYDNVLTFYLD